jgi:RecA/RadA recombinase
MDDFLKHLIKEVGGEYTKLAADISDEETFVDTGSYVLNALISGSIFGGISQQRITGLAADESCGKTFIALNVVKNFLDVNQNGICFYFDTEGAIDTKLLKQKNIDLNRVIIGDVVTIEQFRQKALKLVDAYLKKPASERRPLIIVLDSLGMLSTTKEMNDTAEGKETKDMTRAQVVKSTFRVLTIKLGQAGIPLILTNHTYDSMGSMYPTKEMSGGQGLKYAASTIVYLSKRKDKNAEGEVVGNIIHCKLHKGRFTKENKMVDVKLNYDTGLDQYYGLVELGIAQGVFKKVSNKIQFPNGTSAFESHIYKEPKKYFTAEIIKALEEAAAKEFKYGGGEEIQEEIKK